MPGTPTGADAATGTTNTELADNFCRVAIPLDVARSLSSAELRAKLESQEHQEAARPMAARVIDLINGDT